MNIPRIPCANHLLDSEIKYMISNAPEFLDIVHCTMAALKNSIENSAVLQKLTNFKPEVRNATRWTGQGRMLKRCVRIRPSLIEANEEEDATSSGNFSLVLKKTG